MKIRILKFRNWLLLSLMGLLGVGGCQSSKKVDSIEGQQEVPGEPRIEPRNEIAVMYGVPTVDYVVRGRVVNSKGKPVKGAQVILVNNNIDATADTLYGNRQHIQNYIKRSSDTTKADGRYTVRTQDMPQSDMRIVVRDIDGKENGTFVNQMIDFTPNRPTGQDNWNGTSEQEIEIEVREKE